MTGCDCGGNAHNEEHANDCAGWRLEVEQLTRERDEARSALEKILGIWPYVVCICGRSKPRIPDAFYDAARAALGRGSK